MINKIKVLVVDDEPYSREELKHLLATFNTIEIVGEADSGEDAIIQAIQLQPDIVFLDIEMPKMDGMQTAKSLMEFKNPPKVIFATAYPQFAVEAFRYEAIDYLLKPYDEEQIAETVSRIIKYLKPVILPKQSKIDGKLAIEDNGEIIYIEPRDIIYVYKEDKFSRIITEDNAYETKASLKELENRLSTYSFCRIHKSYFVNLRYINKLSPWFNGAFQLELKGSDEKLSVSRNYVKDLRAKLEI